MAGNRWSKRYAQAIYELATAQDPANVEDALDKWTEDLRLMSEALASSEFSVFLKHAKVPLEKKVDAIAAVLKDVDPLAQNLLSIMVSRGLADMASEVEAGFRDLVDRRRGVERVSVLSAISLEEPERGQIVRFVQDMTNSKVVLDAQVDPSIIGGLVIQIGDKLLDGSTRAKLESLREELETASI